jgi:hypothetical protein
MMKKTAEKKLGIKKFLEYLMGIYYEDEQRSLESSSLIEVTDYFNSPLRKLYVKDKYLIIHTIKINQTIIYEKIEPSIELSEIINPSNVGYKSMTGF